MDTEPLIAQIKAQVLLMFKNQSDLLPKIENEISNFIKQSEDKFKKWQVLYLQGAIDKEELEWLLKSQKNLITLEMLKNAGLSQIKINKIKNDILKLILNLIITAI